MNREDIFKKVQDVLVEALGADTEDVTPDASLKDDLGAESIDYLDIVFRLEKAFSIKIPKGELFPEDLESVRNDPRYVKDGVVTTDGLAEFKRRMPHTDFSEFEKDPKVENASKLVTVNMIVNYIVSKVG